jgi:hypothetical protein
MTDLHARSARLAENLGRMSLGLIGISVLVVMIAIGVGNFVLLTPSPFLVIAGLIAAVSGMLARRACLHPRPATPLLALFASLAACCICAYWIVSFALLGRMH